MDVKLQGLTTLSNWLLRERIRTLLEVLNVATNLIQISYLVPKTSKQTKTQVNSFFNK